MCGYNLFAEMNLWKCPWKVFILFLHKKFSWNYGELSGAVSFFESKGMKQEFGKMFPCGVTLDGAELFKLHGIVCILM